MTETSQLQSKLYRHANAIEAAIEAAAADGFELDLGNGTPLFVLELNHVEDGDFTGAAESVKITVPYSYW